ncbi:MAG: zinc-binding dehydrogenase [Chloroflexi bacterium]|nr:zinc-binding dehydrogenase [Chloroflexota bacterium]
MKAVYLYNHGEPDVLEYGDLEPPLPNDGEIQVRIRAAALNRSDIFTREGWPGLKLQYPHILGGDGAGEVARIGSGPVNFEVGERVVINPSIGCGHCEICLSGRDNLCRDWHLLGETRLGTYAEYVVVPAKNLLKIPGDFPFRSAAASGLVYLTAWHSMVTRGNLQKNERVLIVGASGGVNTASIQVAKHIGAEVIVVGSNEEKLRLAESLGADMLIDRSQDENWSKTAYIMTNKQGVDVVVDNVGAATFPMSMRIARKGGRILTVGNTAGPVFEIDNRYIFGKQLSILGSTMGTAEDFKRVMSLVFDGSLKVVLDRTYPLKDAVQAQKHLARGNQLGKITLDV